MNININVRERINTITPQIKGMNRAIGTAGRKQLLLAMARKFQSMAWASFGASGRYRGNVWKPYSKSYAKKVGTSKPSLMRTGGLRGSIRIYPPRGNSVVVYTGHKFAPVHFFGGGNNIPSRKFFPMEGSGKALWRLTYIAETEMLTEINNRFRTLSGGAFPQITRGSVGRSSYAYGNPMSAASSG